METATIKNLTRHPLLTRAEELDLFSKVEKGDIEARNKIIEANTRLVLYVAKFFVTPQLTLDDAFCAGLIGLEKAIKSFQAGLGNRFSTLAVRCIYTSLVHDYRKRKRIQSMEVSSHFTSVTRSGDVLANSDLDCYRTGEKNIGASKELGVPWLNAVWKSSVNAHNIAIENQEVLDLLGPILASLDDRSQDIIRARFGFPPYNECLTMKTLAEKYGVSKQTISNWQVKALTNIRDALTSDGIKKGIDE